MCRLAFRVGQAAALALKPVISPIQSISPDYCVQAYCVQLLGVTRSRSAFSAKILRRAQLLHSKNRLHIPILVTVVSWRSLSVLCTGDAK